MAISVEDWGDAAGVWEPPRPPVGVEGAEPPATGSRGGAPGGGPGGEAPGSQMIFDIWRPVLAI